MSDFKAGHAAASWKPRPLVTALIPTRNRAHCLPRALESVHAQEQRGECFDLEVIVVDDGSTDATAEVVRRHRDVRYIRLPEWRGVSATVNAGLRASRGAYISLLGDDDVWLPHKLRVQVPLLEGRPEVGVVYGQSLVRRSGEESLWPDATRAPSGRVFEAMLLSNFCGHHASCLIRREAFALAGEFDEELACYEDYEMSLRLAFHVPFLFVPGAVDVYNLAPQGLWMTRAASGAAGRDAARVIEKALRLLPDLPEHAALRRQARLRMVLDAARPMLDTVASLGELHARWGRTMMALRASTSGERASRLGRVGDHLVAAGLLRRELVRALARTALGPRAYTRCARAYRRVARRS
jgi:cellulose synthase/poly-beta-1,6-N-acetylglucosamine synthase-like glycosyltransferase